MSGLEIRLARPHDLPGLADLQWRWRVEEWSGRPVVDRSAFVGALRVWAEQHRERAVPFSRRHGFVGSDEFLHLRLPRHVC